MLFIESFVLKQNFLHLYSVLISKHNTLRIFQNTILVLGFELYQNGFPL